MDFTSTGKQVLLSGQHFADAATPEIAETICEAMIEWSIQKKIAVHEQARAAAHLKRRFENEVSHP